MGYSPEEVAEFDSEETVEAIDSTIRALGYQTERIGNIFELTKALAEGKRWDLVFNIAEGLHGRGREAQVPALLEAWNIPFTFSDSFTMALTLDKAATKSILSRHGVSTGYFSEIKEFKDLENGSFEFPLFLKPVAEGTGKGIRGKSTAHNIRELKILVEELLAEFNQPVLAEELLPGREFTVGIWGTGDKAEVIGTIEIVFNDLQGDRIYNYETKANYKELVTYKPCHEPIATEIAHQALTAYKALGCRDAGRVDIRLDKHDKPVFIEINPLAGLNPIDSDLPILSRLHGVDYKTLLNKIVTSATARIK
jgi:D-alanine-D-alanine ligase